CVLHYGAASRGCVDPFEATGNGIEADDEKKAAYLAPWSARAEEGSMSSLRFTTDKMFEIILDPADTSGQAADHWKAIAKPITFVVPIRNVDEGRTTTIGVTAVLAVEADL